MGEGSGGGAMRRVLLVEDEGVIRMTVAEFLQEEEFDVVEARDGDEAVKLLKDPGHLDVLFTDVRMPGTLDGIDLAFQVRRLHPAMPILVASGYALHLKGRLDCLVPCAVFISKPYSLSQVAETLRHVKLES